MFCSLDIDIGGFTRSVLGDTFVPAVDVASVYSQAVGASYEQSDVSEDTDMDTDSLDGSQQYALS